MEPGIYESLVTQALAEELRGLDESFRVDLSAVGEADQPDVLTQHAATLIRRAMRGRNASGRLDLLHKLVELIGEPAESAVGGTVQQLFSITDQSKVGTPASQSRPSTPMNDVALLTNARGEPGLGAELRAELASATEIALVCAFIKWRGLRTLELQLAECRRRGVPFRVITTTYMGATEARAVDRLVREFGAQVKIQYDSLRTRLHAKAWLFQRTTGFHTAYVGSSNLSESALLDGVEWNVRLSVATTPSLLEKFSATFETYWNDPSFESYDPDSDRERLDQALAIAGGRTGSDRVTVSLAGVEVRPYPYQQDMLDRLEAERVIHDRHRNLVVAATGTGKTVLAALDYRRLAQAGRPSLLFVAHRREILTQALRTYREVLNSPTFGELLVDGHEPSSWSHVFASVQSLNQRRLDQISQDHFEIVVIDEFHHGEAPTYRKIWSHLEPKELLALTATPERTDGLDVQQFFEGRIAAELRLWDALESELLCPFHYFGLADGTDLGDVPWVRGSYDVAKLDELYTGNDRRSAVILEQVREKIEDPGSMRALGFCVSVAHAEYMAQVFTAAGLAAVSVSGRSPQDERAQSIRLLESGKIVAIFAADLFNEGVDIPSVDTVLFLRPTESSTLFLQQLGRGLRRSPGKAVLTALDFVGHHRREFRFDRKLRALTGQSRSELTKSIEKGFDYLPAGCEIALDSVVQAQVLLNVKNQIGRRWSDLVQEARQLRSPVSLPRFLEEAGVELSDVVKKSGNRSWTRLQRDAGWTSGDGSDLEKVLLGRTQAFAHVNDSLRARVYRRLIEGASPAALTERERKIAEMLRYSLWPSGGGFQNLEEALRALLTEPAAKSEIAAIVDLAFARSHTISFDLSRELRELPLQVHAQYSREEILIGLGYKRTPPEQFREGVYYSRELNLDAFFITLHKSEKNYSPTTLYRDYPISSTLFHWESQSTTSSHSPTGERYINHQSRGSHILLFCRVESSNEFGVSPYVFLGPATYVSHEGDRPMAITWKLEHELPAEFLIEASVA